ncbi:MAG: hypothetical protein MHM6MM_002022 [Cercozoa sp. M6MM]
MLKFVTRAGQAAARKPSLLSMRQLMVQVPSMGDSITEGVLSTWQREEGDWCNEDDVVAVIESDKLSIDVRAPVSGILMKKFVSEDDEIEVGADLMEIDETAEKPEGADAPKEEVATPAPQAAATPQKTPETPKAAPTPAAPKQAIPDAPTLSTGVSREERRVPMSRMRQRIAQRLKESQNEAASLTTFNEIDMSNLMAMRSQYKDEFFEKHGVKLGFMSAFVKASTYALQRQPIVNAIIDGKDVVYRDYNDISVAVASPNGLVVPVLRNTEAMSFADVEANIARYGAMARDGALGIEDMTGGTFTISNGGVFGSLMGTPIINQPQSAILGMHGVFQRPVAVNGEVEIRPMMYIALTYDHRIVDGREAVTFLRDIKAAVEDPRRLLLDL